MKFPEEARLDEASIAADGKGVVVNDVPVASLEDADKPVEEPVVIKDMSVWSMRLW